MIQFFDLSCILCGEALAARLACGVCGKYILAQPNAAQLTEIAMLADAGHIEPFISQVLPLKEACQAHQLSQKGHTRGKIVLQVIESDI